MDNWVEIRKAGNFTEISKECNISPITARVLRNRDLTERGEIEKYLSPYFNAPSDPFLLTGMKDAVDLMLGYIKSGEKIRIIGDYDVDGISSTYILFRGLKYFGADTDYVIPHRIEDGYGINKNLITNASNDGRTVIITCDNGIAAYDEVIYAHELGLKMIVTDHHEVPYTLEGTKKNYRLPPAEAVVDPHIEGDKFPFSGICGAYVAYLFIYACAVSQGKINTSGFNFVEEELREFAAIATVCDVMELKGENRPLVASGMKLMAHSKNLGMKTLVDVTGLTGKVLSPYHLGFVLGPCLNASGRLDTSMRALELFTQSDETKAYEMAEELKLLNEERKEMTVKGTEKASQIVDSEPLPKVIAIILEDCHESLAGIIAGRIREKYSRPTFVFTPTKDGIKGSGRSIDAYNMYEGLNKVSDLLSKYGGHKLAAGVSMKTENFDEFKRRINEDADLTEKDFIETLRIDMALDPSNVNLSLARELERLEPYGQGNEKPLFATLKLTFLSGARLGKNGNFAKYKVKASDNRIYELVSFKDPDEMEAYVEKIFGPQKAMHMHDGQYIGISMDVAYTIEINSYKNNDTAQLRLASYR